MKFKREDKIWIWVGGAFLLLIAAWALFIYIAVKNSPERIDPQTHQTSP